MLVVVVALAYSIVEEYRRAHCLMGSVSGYYYTPVRPVFIGMMLVIGIALVVIKGRTAFEDACFSIAGLMAPVVAFIPTSDDLGGACRAQMLAIGHYQPSDYSGFIPASINNNLHTVVFAGAVTIVLLLVAKGIERLRRGSLPDFTTGSKINLALGIALVGVGWASLHWFYSWVLQAHAWAACAVFGFLAVAAIGNCVVGLGEPAATRFHRGCAVLRDHRGRDGDCWDRIRSHDPCTSSAQRPRHRGH